MAEPAIAGQVDLRCAACPVRHHAVCKALEGRYFDELTGIMSHRHFHAGQELLHQDTDSQLFAIITAGFVKLTHILPDGREQIVGLLHASDVLGDINATASHDNAICVSDVELCCFRKRQFEAVLDKYPDLGLQLLERTNADLNQAREWITVLGKLGAMEKVAHFLYWLWSQQAHSCPFNESEGASHKLNLLLKREEIANFLGLTMETVSRNITKLRRNGVIELEDAKTISVRDVEQLRALAVFDE